MKLDNTIIIESILKELNLEYVREYKFHPKRRFRFDFAILKLKIGIEYEGGIYNFGRHVRGRSYTSDCIKYNLAQIEGWKVLRYTVNMVEENPAQIYNDLKYLRDQENVYNSYNS